MEKSNSTNKENLLMKEVDLKIERIYSKIFTQIWTVFGIFLVFAVLLLGYQFFQVYNYQKAMERNLKEVEIISESVRNTSKPILETWKNISTSEQIIRNLLSASTEYIRGNIILNDRDTSSLKMALSAFETTVDKAPYWPLGYQMKAYSLMRLGKYDESIETVNKALELVGIDDYSERELLCTKVLSLPKRGLKEDKKNASGIFEYLLKEKKRDEIELVIYAVLNMENEMIVLLKELIETNKINKYYIQEIPEFEPFLNQQNIKDILTTK